MLVSDEDAWGIEDGRPTPQHCDRSGPVIFIAGTASESLLQYRYSKYDFGSEGSCCKSRPEATPAELTTSLSQHGCSTADGFLFPASVLSR